LEQILRGPILKILRMLLPASSVVHVNAFRNGRLSYSPPSLELRNWTILE